MILKLLASRGGRALLLTAAAALGFLLSTLVLRHGMKAWPDSWYDWQGSVNLIEHGAYTTMLGVPIHDWPPFYSVYLAVFEQLFGQTGWTLIFSTCVLVALNVAVWGAYIFKVFPMDEKQPAAVAILASLAFLVCFLPTYFISVLPNGLLLFFVGLILHLLTAIAEDPSPWGGVRKSALVGLLLGTGIFTHNSTIIYVVASVVVILASMPTGLRQRLIAVGLILLISGSAWMLVPHGLSVKAKHVAAPVVSTGAPAKYKTDEGTHFLFDPKYSFGEYLVQTPQGFGVFFISTSSVPVQATLGVVILATSLFFLVRRPESKLESRQRVCIGFALLLVLGHFAIFNLVWLDTVFGDRFAWYFALVMVPIFFYHFRRNRPMIALLVLLTIGVSGWRMSKLIRTGAVPALVTTSAEAPIGAIHPEYFVTSVPHPVVPAGSILIETPVYRWQTMADGSPPPRIHETVTLVLPGTSRP